MSGFCGCGCGEATARRYRPGHDARHKADLKARTQDRRWWVRERAVWTMVEMGWGRHVDSAILASTPVRSRYKGRFTETRHIDSLHGMVLDDEGTGHSVWFCPARSSHGRWVKGGAGWACGVCIHTRDATEIVHSPGYGLNANSTDLPVFTPARKPNKRGYGHKTSLVLDPHQAALMASAYAGEPEPTWTPPPRRSRTRMLRVA